MRASILICITLACIAVNFAEANEQVEPSQKTYGFFFRLPGIYKPPVAVVPPTCTNDKTGCPTGDTCASGQCTTAAAPATPCASAASCAATCTATQCKVCEVAC